MFSLSLFYINRETEEYSRSKKIIKTNRFRYIQNSVDSRKTGYSTQLLGDHSEMEPPDPFSNSVVKRLSADGSVAGAM